MDGRLPTMKRLAAVPEQDQAAAVVLALGGITDFFDGMLARMFGTSGDGIHDRLLDFTRAVTGSYYFAPSVEDLAAVGG